MTYTELFAIQGFAIYRCEDVNRKIQMRHKQDAKIVGPHRHCGCKERWDFAIGDSPIWSCARIISICEGLRMHFA